MFTILGSGSRAEPVSDLETGKKGRGTQIWLVSIQETSFGTLVTKIASMLGTTHKYARRLIFFGNSIAEQNGEKITEID